MRFGVLGTGVVGQTIAGKLVSLGHEVRMGSRAAGNQKAVAWAAEAGEQASEGSFADAASFGDLVVNCTSGSASLAALEAAGADNLEGKILIDVANPLDFSGGMPPSLSVCNTDSLGEQIQQAYPDAKVVKTLNTVNADVMVDPIPGTTMFVSGNDEDAKDQVVGLLETFGWPREAVLDLGDITAARGTEMYVALWVRLLATLGTAHFNISLTR